MNDSSNYYTLEQITSNKIFFFQTVQDVIWYYFSNEIYVK